MLTLRPPAFAIRKAASPRHLEENADAAAVRLLAEDVELIDAAFPLGPCKPGVPTI